MSNLAERYGSWALVSGGTSGIGAALVDQIAASGMNVVLVARTQAKLDAQADAIRKAHNVEVRTVSADLSSAEGLESVIHAVSDLEIGLLVPCAAMETSGYFVDSPLETQRALLQMDVVAPMVLTHHFGAKMAARRRGAILLVSSLSGWMAQPYMAGYGAAKAYILGLGAALHEEMKDQGVDVSVLSPGPTDTPMAASTGIDFGSMGMSIMKPEDVARTALAALGKRADAVPGFRNRMMVFMMTRMTPRAIGGFMFKRMLGRALKIQAPLALADGRTT